MRKASMQRQTNLVDVLDRVLDKGVIIEAHADISFAGISLIGAEARMLVASLDAYLAYSDAPATSSTWRAITSSDIHPSTDRSTDHCATRRRHRGKRSIEKLICIKGCSFQRSIAEPREPAGTVECPYRPAARCVLKPLTGFQLGRKHK
jgi:hypothetical protein